MPASSNIPRGLLQNDVLREYTLEKHVLSLRLWIHARKDTWEKSIHEGLEHSKSRVLPLAMNHREHNQTWPDHFNPKSNMTEYVLSLTVCLDINAGPSKWVMNLFSSAGGEHSRHSNHTGTPVHASTKQKPGIWPFHRLCHLTAGDEPILWSQNSSCCNKPAGFRV